MCTAGSRINCELNVLIATNIECLAMNRRVFNLFNSKVVPTDSLRLPTQSIAAVRDNRRVICQRYQLLTWNKMNASNRDSLHFLEPPRNSFTNYESIARRNDQYSIGIRKRNNTAWERTTIFAKRKHPNPLVICTTGESNDNTITA